MALKSVLFALTAYYVILTHLVYRSEGFEDYPDDKATVLPDEEEDESSDASLRISNGVAAALGEFPYMVGILIPSDTKMTRWTLCGGTLITSRHVLTAAHCVNGSPNEVVSLSKTFVNQLTLRKNDTNPGHFRTVASYVVHPSYQVLPWFSDIAVVTLNEEVTDVPFVQLPTVPTIANPMLLGKSGIVIGWGNVGPSKETSPNMLKTGVKVINLIQCSLKLGFPVLVGAQICTSSPITATEEQPGSDACAGDSGGPLLVDGVQVGIVSLGSVRRPCGTRKSATVYTSVAYHINWIRGHLT